MSKPTFTAVLFMLLLVSGALPVLAQSQGFTPTSTVVQLDANTFRIGVEALFNQAGVFTFSLPFALPSNRTIVALQGTVSHKANCFAESLASVNVNGKVYPMKTKLTRTGGATTTFVKYEIPQFYSTGNGQIIVSNAQVCNTTFGADQVTTWEFQGLLRLQ